MLEYRVLGPLQVERDGHAVALSAPKVKTLLLALLLRPNDVVPTDHLMAVIWGDHPPDSARKLVQVYVSQLRSSLGADAIETVAQGYRVRVAATGLDSQRFDRMRADGRTALADGNPELALALARRALSLWRGPALSDVAYEPFASAAAARLDELRLDCAGDELDAELALGRHDDVIPALRQLCAAEPLRERSWERLALALYRSQRQSEALAALASGRRALLDGLGLEPGKGLRQLELAILNHDPSLDAMTPDVSATLHLPAPRSALIGRRDDLQQLRSLVLQDDVRLVTISGAGGSGKTRVALELARSIGHAFGNGAAFVELASIQDPSAVIASIARALGVTETPAETAAEALTRWLPSRDLLLVVDNVEHVIESAGDLVRLMQVAPRLTIVATSRRVLHVSGEHVYPLGPLPIDEAVQLFAERAAARDVSDLADVDNRDVVPTICRRLDCLPLAVELAAARAATLGPELLLARLSDRVPALGVGPRDAPARQQTLLDTLQWSTDLLSEVQRRTFARLSVFAGGSSVEAAEAVAETDIQCLSDLIDSSLLQRTAAAGSIRLSMLETIRAHAAQLLDATGERAVVEARHGAYYVELVEALDLKSPYTQAEALSTVDTDLDNLRSAMDRVELVADDDTALRVATAMYRYFYKRGIFREGRDRIGGPLWLGAGDAHLRAFALRALSGMHFMLGDLDNAEGVARQGIEVGGAAGAEEAVMACHTVVSHIAPERGMFDEARVHLERSEALARQLRLDEDVIVANTNLGELALAVGDLAEAQRRWELSMSTYDEDDVSCTFALLGLASIAHRQGLLEEAERYFTQVRSLAEGAGWWHNATMAIVGLAGIAADRGAHAESALLLGRASALLATTGGELVLADETIYQSAREAAIADLGEARFVELLSAGATGSMG
ncbi:MAG: AfsR/SARP family transcriptional regulator [Ilumatobacteraceae bacterium]